MEIERDPKRWRILGILCLSVFLVVVDNTIVNVALPALSTSLHATNSQLQWIVDAYSLPFAGLLLAGGGLSDRLGRRRVMQSGLFFFALFSALAAYSTSSGTLITARALMGVAAAFVFPASLAILTTTFTDSRERAQAFGLWGAVSGAAVAFGPITGGFLITHFWFGSVFLVNIPIVAIALVANHLVLPESKSPVQQKIDLGGLALGTVGITSLVLAIIQGPSWGWLSVTTLGLFALSALSLIIFCLYELRRSEPLLDVRVFRVPAFSAGAGSIATAFFTLFGFIFLITQYFQLVRGYSALSAGVHTLPFAITSMVVTPLGALLALKFGTRITVSGGLFIMAISMVWMGTQSATAPFFGPVVCQMITMSIGFSLINAPSTAAVMGSLSARQIGAGSAVNNVTRELGGTLGVAIVGSVFSSVFGPLTRSAFTSVGAGAVDSQRASTSMQAALGAVRHIPFESARVSMTSHITEAFMSGLHRGCFVAAGISALVGLTVYFYLPARERVEKVS